MTTFIRRLNSTIVAVILISVALIVLWPVVHLIAAAFTPGRSMANMPAIPFSNGLTTDHFVHLFKNTEYLRWFRNTLIIAVATSVGTMVFASLSAYVFSRFRFTFKRPLLMTMLILQIFPSFVGMVAIYVLLFRIGGLDTLWGMILIYLAGNMPFNTWLVKSYLDQIPISLDEAARIDGASNLRIYVQIILPVAKPILTFLAVTSFTAPWMDFILPKLILRSPKNQTLALGLFSFVTDKNNFFTTFAAGALLVAIPFVVFFLITQKSLISSLASGGVKE